MDENRARLKDAIDKGIVPVDHPQRAHNDLPPPIRPDVPLLTDAHQNGRRSFDNMEQKPGEVARSKRATETRRRISDPTSPKYKY